MYLFMTISVMSRKLCHTVHITSTDFKLPGNEKDDSETTDNLESLLIFHFCVFKQLLLFPNHHILNMYISDIKPFILQAATSLVGKRTKSTTSSEFYESRY